MIAWKEAVKALTSHSPLAISLLNPEKAELYFKAEMIPVIRQSRLSAYLLEDIVVQEKDILRRKQLYLKGYFLPLRRAALQGFSSDQQKQLLDFSRERPSEIGLQLSPTMEVSDQQGSNLAGNSISLNWNLDLLERVLSHPNIDVVKTISSGVRRQIVSEFSNLFNEVVQYPENEKSYVNLFLFPRAVLRNKPRSDLRKLRKKKTLACSKSIYLQQFTKLARWRPTS